MSVRLPVFLKSCNDKQQIVEISKHCIIFFIYVLIIKLSAHIKNEYAVNIFSWYYLLQKSVALRHLYQKRLSFKFHVCPNETIFLNINSWKVNFLEWIEVKFIFWHRTATTSENTSNRLIDCLLVFITEVSTPKTQLLLLDFFRFVLIVWFFSYSVITKIHIS